MANHPGSPYGGEESTVVALDTVELVHLTHNSYMLLSPAFLRSLLLASTFSFAAPIVLISLVLGALWGVAEVPLTATIALITAEKLVAFLSVFGSGDAVQGMFIIGVTCATVGALFDTYAFYRYQR